VTGVGPFGRSAGYRIVLYQRAFTERRILAVLFHELVHVVRGWELDAEAFENALFTRQEGARPPTLEDWELFREAKYQGWWVRVDPRTGDVTDFAGRHVVTFRRP